MAYPLLRQWEMLKMIPRARKKKAVEVGDSALQAKTMTFAKNQVHP